MSSIFVFIFMVRTLSIRSTLLSFYVHNTVLTASVQFFSFWASNYTYIGPFHMSLHSFLLLFIFCVCALVCIIYIDLSSSSLTLLCFLLNPSIELLISVLIIFNSN